MVSKPKLELCSDQFEFILKHAGALTEGLSDEVVQARTGTEWSMVDVLEHLTLTAKTYLPKLERGLGGSRVESALTLGRRTFAGRIILWLMEPPLKFRLPAPDRFRPRRLLPLLETIEGFRKVYQNLMDLSLFVESGMPAAGRVEWVIKSIKFDVYESLEILAAHARRHLLQLEKIRANHVSSGS